jgi:hypothetical protein
VAGMSYFRFVADAAVKMREDLYALRTVKVLFMSSCESAKCDYSIHNI